MKAILLKLLQKKGINNVADLSNDEKSDFDRWDKILSEGDISVDKIKDFLNQQIKIIESQYTNPDNSEKKDNYLKACLSVYTSILKIIDGPIAERQALEKYLQQLLQ